ncbi:hypothetical protein CABS01_16595 [Colletotrichum abscissum]|uniref:uncharacterized protein n=1 Tax=Colletotrichum abscissum TaxID=1671311 RepID=UPI0027D6B0A1|nr:uncharacterized protein CABS01_16595 [Colletotrichum abscissum]KAK1519311.1 hypothetical protein CABS01_16595 [Colletotrichum abscissum]
MLPVLLKRVQAILDFLQHSSNDRSLLSDSPLQNTIFCSLSRVESEVKFLDETIRRHLHCFSQPGRLSSVSPVYEPSSTQNSSIGPNAGKLVEAQACVLSVRLPSSSSIVTCREEAFSAPLNSTSLAETNTSLTGVDRATVRGCRADPASRDVCFVDLTTEHSPRYGAEPNAASFIDVGPDHNPDPATEPRTSHGSFSRSIVKLIDKAVEHVHVGWLSCRDQAHFRQRLDQFCPGRYVDDVLLLAILQSVCGTSTLHTIDPLLVQFSEPFLPSGASAFAKGFDGVVLPINVNAADQMSDYNRNHWVLAIVNWKTETFDGFGMQPTAFSRWSVRIDEYVSELRGAVIQLDKRSHELGPYWEDSCCAFLCAYALERYLGRAPHRQERWPTGPALRKHYLRKLLNQWELPAGRRTKGPRHSGLGGGPSSG